MNEGGGVALASRSCLCGVKWSGVRLTSDIVSSFVQGFGDLCSASAVVGRAGARSGHLFEFDFDVNSCFVLDFAGIGNGNSFPANIF